LQRAIKMRWVGCRGYRMNVSLRINLAVARISPVAGRKLTPLRTRP